MKNRKILIFVALATVMSLFFSLGASAAGARASRAAGKASNASARLQVVAAVKAQNAVRQQIRQVIVQIRQDLAGTSNIAAITSTQDYQDVIAALNSAKSSVTGLKIQNIWKQYKSSTDKTAALSDALAQLNSKTDTLKNVLASLQAVLPKAENIAKLKQSLKEDYSQFQSAAELKKETINSNRETIGNLNDANSALINTIVATVSANQDLLAAHPDEIAKIGQTLIQIADSLKTEYNGKIVQANKLYEQYRRNGQYDLALAQLDLIISIQNDRITLLTNVKTQLQGTLDELNALVGPTSSASSSDASSASSEAA